MMAAITDRDRGDETSVELEPVLLWRFEYLNRAGYSVLASWGLAENLDVDIHFAAKLLEDGCRPDVAVEILS